MWKNSKSNVFTIFFEVYLNNFTQKNMKLLFKINITVCKMWQWYLTWCWRFISVDLSSLFFLYYIYIIFFDVFCFWNLMFLTFVRTFIISEQCGTQFYDFRSYLLRHVTNESVLVTAVHGSECFALVCWVKPQQRQFIPRIILEIQFSFFFFFSFFFQPKLFFSWYFNHSFQKIKKKYKQKKNKKHMD